MEWKAVVALLASFILPIVCNQLKNPHNFNYILNNPDICREEIDFLIWVHSGPANYRRRIALRETWANPKNMPNFPTGLATAKVVFFLGAIRNDTIQRRIVFESEVYQDIVQEDYIDNYRNLTYKAMSGLKWIDKHCKSNQIKIILKTDDDMMIFTDRLQRHLQSMTGFPTRPVTNTIICDVWVNRKVERTAGMKWSVSKDEFSRDRYPTYCPGLALLMTPDLVHKLWIKALETQYFWVDDVFFTGLLVENLNVTWVQMGSLFHFGGALLPKTFVKDPSNFIFGHVFSYRTDLFYYLWRRVNPSQDVIYHPF